MATREATADDVEQIQQVVKASWETDYPDILSRESIDAGIDDWYSRERLLDQLERRRTLLLVAEADGTGVDGTVVGFVHGLWEGAEGDVLRLYVHPDHRGEGVGGDLLERTLERLSARDVDRIEAMVLAANDPGNAFYRSFGFEQVDTGETTIGGESYRENTYERTL